MKYIDYFLENATIHDGPPVRYRLPCSQTSLDGVGGEFRLRKVTAGKNSGKQNKTILLVGETGSGKSTLINSILNYVMGVKEADSEWYEIIENTRKDSQSQTTEVTVYEIFGFEDKTVPYSVTIIDTPGYGDTRGINYDSIITQSLHDLFRSGEIQDIHAVALVMKATDNRLNDRLRYIFDSVTSLFGKDMEKNVVALITHSDGMPPENAVKALEDAKIKCARNEKNQPVYFVFNNCLSEEKTEETESGLKQAWIITTSGMRQFSTFLEKNTPQKLETTVNVLKERSRLAACINNLIGRIKLIKLKQNMIQQTQEELEKHKEDSFNIQFDEPYKEKGIIDSVRWWPWKSGAVTCSVCKENCHHPCTETRKPEHCEVIQDGCCTICTGKCPASDHVREKWIYVNKTLKITKTISQLKDRFTADKDQSENLLSCLQTEKEKLEKEKDESLDEAYQHVVSLEQIALNVNSLLIHAHLDLLIEMMKEKGDEEKVQKLEEMVARVDEGTRAALKKMFDYVDGQITAGKNFVK